MATTVQPASGESTKQLINYRVDAGVAVIELSVGSGLVTVLFVFAINIAGEEAISKDTPFPRLGAWVLVVVSLGLLAWLVRAGEPLMTGWLGLPAEASAAFVMGFLRRDFGATGLFAMQSQGLLTPLQVVVAMVTITLFIPCIASVMMIAKERGGRTALGMFVLIIPLALLVGGILYRILLFTGWGV